MVSLTIGIQIIGIHPQYQTVAGNFGGIGFLEWQARSTNGLIEGNGLAGNLTH